MAGIVFAPGAQAHLIDVKIADCDVGIEANGAEVTASNLQFERVRQPFNVDDSQFHLTGTRIGPQQQPTSTGDSRVGWTGQGPSLPAHCGKCGLIFSSRNYGFRTSLFYGRDNEDICPVCDHPHAKVAEGLFEITTEAIALVFSLATDFDRLAALHKTATQVLAGTTSVDSGIQAMEATSPAIKSLTDKASGHGFNAAWFIGLFISVLVAYLFHIASQKNDIGAFNHDLVQEKCLNSTNTINDNIIKLHKDDKLNKQVSSYDRSCNTESELIERFSSEASKRPRLKKR